MIRRGSVTTQFCEHWGERSAAVATRKALGSMLPGLSNSGLPINLESISRYFGIDQVTDAEITGADGVLSATSSGSYVVRLRKSQPIVRKRFTLAHEIGHAVVFNSIGTKKAGRESFKCKAETPDQKDEEELCDLVASELLMPQEPFLNFLADTGTSARSLTSIAQKFGVSLQAASLRVLREVPYDISFSLWKRYATRNHIVPIWYFTSRGSVSQHSIGIGQIGSACFKNTPFRGTQWIPLNGSVDKHFVDVFPFGDQTPNSWLVMVVFGGAPQHIMTKINRGREETSAQLSIHFDD